MRSRRRPEREGPAGCAVAQAEPWVHGSRRKSGIFLTYVDRGGEAMIEVPNRRMRELAFGPPRTVGAADVGKVDGIPGECFGGAEAAPAERIRWHG
ncbi:MAG: hypothetical protein ACREFP_21880 [Acetobacteraceae bacterium]